MRLPYSVATIIGLAFHYAGFYLFGLPLWTDAIAEWIMARTPLPYAVSLLETFGLWAKPFAVTGGLATLGFAVLLVGAAGRRQWAIVCAAAAAASILLSNIFDYHSIAGQLTFWIPAVAAILFGGKPNGALAVTRGVTRRQAFAMVAGTAAVAVESYARNRSLAARAVQPVTLPPLPPLVDRDSFGGGLVRKAVTPTGEFYGMSKNTVDPAIDPKVWRLKITHDGKLIREFSYAELLSLPRISRDVTLRCVSNTLKSDLMGTAHWNGIHLSQLLDPRQVPPGTRELAVAGADGHGDSFAVDYAFSNETMFALGMNGQTLNRAHGFPIRLLAPRYYGFKNVKWISELAFVSEPYFGTWPKLGYTKEPVIHTASHIDRFALESGRIRCGGVSFAGNRGVRAVQVRADRGPWVDAVLETALSEYTLTRWYAEIPASHASTLEARARDGLGNWQSGTETPLFPNGVDGPTIRSISSR